MAPTDGRAASARAAAPPDGAVSARAEAVPPFVVMEVMAQAAAQEAALAAAGSATRVVHLEVGQPAAGAPAAARAAAVAALEDPADALGYTAALGEPPLRAAIAALYGRRYGVELRPEHVAVTTGSSGAFIAAFACLWDAGDRVCCPVPGYPCYRNCLGALGARVVMLETHAGDGYAPTVAALEAEEAAAGPLAGLVLASPGNPTGRALSRAQLLDLARFCDARRIPLVVDEIYHGIGAAPVPW
jgi:aspartate/methionine/tyrosine aminotransferase